MNKSGWSRHGRPPLCNCRELPGHPGENARSGAPGVSISHAVPQVVPNRGRRNSGSHATTAIVKKSSISIGAYRNVGHGRRPGRQLAPTPPVQADSLDQWRPLFLWLWALYRRSVAEFRPEQTEKLRLILTL